MPTAISRIVATYLDSQQDLVSDLLLTLSFPVAGRVTKVRRRNDRHWTIAVEKPQQLFQDDLGTAHWEETYASPVSNSIVRSLNAKFGRGSFDCESDRYGTFEVFKTSASRIVATYLERLTEEAPLETDSLRRGLSPRAYQLYTLLVESCGEVDFDSDEWCKVNLASVRSQIEGQKLGDTTTLLAELAEAGVWKGGKVLRVTTP